jgi:hypothetical protein
VGAACGVAAGAVAEIGVADEVSGFVGIVPEVTETSATVATTEGGSDGACEHPTTAIAATRSLERMVGLGMILS